MSNVIGNSLPLSIGHHCVLVNLIDCSIKQHVYIPKHCYSRFKVLSFLCL